MCSVKEVAPSNKPVENYHLTAVPLTFTDCWVFQLKFLFRLSFDALISIIFGRKNWAIIVIESEFEPLGCSTIYSTNHSLL